MFTRHEQAERCHHVHDGSRERRQTAIPRRRNRERKRAPEPIGLPKTDALRTLPKLQLAPPDQRQVQHCGRLVQQSRIDHDGCHTEGRGVQKGHTGAPRERLPFSMFSLRCWSPRSRKKSEATSTPTSSRRQQERITTVVMPFLDGVTQPLQRVLKPLDIRVVGKPVTWKWCLHVQHLLKDSSNRDEEPGVVYRLTCNDCDQTYIAKPVKPGAQRAHAQRTCFVGQERTLRHVGRRGPRDHQPTQPFIQDCPDRRPRAPCCPEESERGTAHPHRKEPDEQRQRTRTWPDLI